MISVICIDALGYVEDETICNIAGGRDGNVQDGGPRDPV